MDAQTKMQAEPAVTRIAFAMDTALSCTVAVHDADVLKPLEDMLEELAWRFNAYSATSEIANIARDAGKRPTRVSSVTFDIISRALALSEETEGFFDITMRPLVHLWQESVRAGILPGQRDLEAAQELVGYEKVSLDRKRSTVWLEREGMALDLGGIAKGYALDEARKMLDAHHVSWALLDFGGSVLPYGRTSSVGIQDPFAQTGTPCARIKVRDIALVTSGSYERSSDVQGRHCHHLIDPRTAQPSQSDLVSVTLAGTDATRLDALATAVFLMGTDHGSRFVEKAGLDAAFMTQEGQVLATRALAPSLRLLHNPQHTE
ncbi:MAG: FAD:protein FMN transferase [Coriobacteriaceae bacterium]|jgi:FAD:protein FMN transferase|nr:FAD:protein FMN transferase [Atopobium sp.]MCH4080812.1 FAD:protein FMN transferase [Atopobiaceae bacterium]RRF91573.1 MAG: FAD:protein FMN transferase [Coriobacteriaceae bacterium]MCI1344067.1 FAD:protein FMN transferase [Atopobiaceae bacterium]MCI1497584.1 FAD:protein FMN transferase [Atopobiaceae bacterium]